MRAPGYSPFLFLMLALIPQPGVLQGAHNWKHCQDCKKLLTVASMNDRFYQNLVKNAKYDPCPNKVARFEVPRGIFCGLRGEAWVEKVIGCINQGREPCLKPSENQQQEEPSHPKKVEQQGTEGTQTPRQTEGGVLSSREVEGVSQGDHNWKLCKECKILLKDSDVTETFYQILIKNADYTACSNNISRFQLLGEIFCGHIDESWVDIVTGCIIKGRLPCRKTI